MKRIYKTLRKIVIGIVGVLVVILGFILIPLPGPGLLVIVAGLAILSLEFEWADRQLSKIKQKLETVSKKIRPQKKDKKTRKILD